MAHYQHYRGSTLGISLADSLDDLIRSNDITPDLATRVLAQFDRSISEALSTKIKSRYNCKVLFFFFLFLLFQFQFVAYSFFF